jgi:hypothetical protein
MVPDTRIPPGGLQVTPPKPVVRCKRSSLIFRSPFTPVFISTPIKVHLTIREEKHFFPSTHHKIVIKGLLKLFNPV